MDGQETTTPDGTAGPVITDNRTILLAEDDASVRRFVYLTLHIAGYNVLEATDGEDAVRVSDEYDGPIHLLLTDVIMPKMNGRRACRAITASRPVVKVLYMSGYAEDIIAHRGELEPGAKLLRKPFSTTELLGAVHLILMGGPSTSSIHFRGKP